MKTALKDLVACTINPTAAKLYGSEVAATSWEAANPAAPVSMQELATFRTQGNASTIYWYGAAQQQSHQLFAIPGNEGQTLLPTLADGSLATASFTPGGAFGIRDGDSGIMERGLLATARDRFVDSVLELEP